jgi:hypothetical protein
VTPLFGFGKRRDRDREPRWVAVYFAQNLPEAELHAARLAEARIPSFIRRTAGMDVADMLAGGMREVLVPEQYELEARAVLDPYDPLDVDEEPAG